MGKYKEKYKSRFCIRRLFLVTVRVFNRDSEKIVLVLANRGSSYSRVNQLALTQETAKLFLDN